MSGHSKWSTIKHKKGKADAARGRLFTKLIREITVAARMGGGDLSGNPRLRAAVDAARAANMPGDNIQRGIKKGTGELAGVSYEDVTYEAYGPDGCAILIDVTTDNRNRSLTDIRTVVNKNGGKMAEAGAVGWVFEQKGLVIVAGEGVTEDDLMMVVLDAGAEELEAGDAGEDEDATFEVTTPFTELDVVRTAVEGAGFKVREAKPVRIPTTTVALTGKAAEQALRLVDLLEDLDDVTHVWANFDIDEETLAALDA